MKSKLINSEIGSRHWFNTLLARFIHTGEFMKDQPLTDEQRIDWGDRMIEAGRELCDNYVTIKTYREPPARSNAAPHSDSDFAKAELMDRAFILSSMFDDFILQHEVVTQNPHLEEAATRISDLLGEFYQQAGELAHNDYRHREEK